MSGLAQRGHPLLTQAARLGLSPDPAETTR